MAKKQLKMWGMMGGLLLIHCHPAMGQCVIENILKGEFSNFFGITEVRNPWYTEGKVWIQGGNARSDHNAGWNAIHQFVSLQAKTGYALTAFVRTSHNGGYLGFRGAGLPKPVQTMFDPQTDFRTVRVTFTPAQAGRYDVFAGFSALDKEARMEVNAVRLETLSGGCSDVITKPAD